MKHPVARYTILLGLLGLFGQTTARAAGHKAGPIREIRAFWADGFGQGFKTPEQIDTLLARLRAAHCNAIFAQVRKGGDAYYLSRYEPWAADDPQHFDALAYLIEKAHSGTPRIQVHAWINTCAVGKTYGNPFHIAAAHPEWLSLSDKGETYDNEATKIDPGNPDAADWTFRVYLDVVRHYDVDGIHFDFVRYGSTDGKGRWGYNPVSVARFNTRYGRSEAPRWDAPLWKQWRRDQVTALVRKVYAIAASVKPHVTVSAATVTWTDGPQDMAFWNEKSAPMNRVFQDWRAWMQEGILDLNCQMSYYQEARHRDWFRHWIDWGKDHQYGRWAVPSSGIWLNPIADSFRQIAAIRKPSRKGRRAHGILLYSYAGTNAGPKGEEVTYNEEFYSALCRPSRYAAKPPFAEPAEFPPLPWKEHPKTGILKGFVLTADALNPVDGAILTVTGKTRRTQRTDGTGFYAFVDLPPGHYKVRVAASGYAREEERVSVPPGRQHNQMLLTEDPDFFLGGALVPLRYAVENLYSLPDQPLHTPVAYRDLLVVGGTDVFPDNLLVIDEHQSRIVRVRLMRPPLLPFQAGDVVAVVGNTAIDDGELVIDNAIARLVGMEQIGSGDNQVRLTPQPRIGSEIVQDYAGIPLVTRLEGKVTDVRPDRFVLNDGAPIEVMLAGRKDPDVEAAETPLPAPEVGRFVQVTGIVTVTKHPDGTTLIRIRPRSAEEIRLLPTPPSEKMKAIVAWILLSLALMGALACGMKLRNRGRQPTRLKDEKDERHL